jgi:hypothetical protein
MRPLYDARLRDLGGRDLVKVTCQACSHMSRLADAYLRRPAFKVEEYQTILALKRRLRCSRCHTIGHVDITIEWRG